MLDVASNRHRSLIATLALIFGRFTLSHAETGNVAGVPPKFVKNPRRTVNAVPRVRRVDGRYYLPPSLAFGLGGGGQNLDLETVPSAYAARAFVLKPAVEGLTLLAAGDSVGRAIGAKPVEGGTVCAFLVESIAFAQTGLALQMLLSVTGRSSTYVAIGSSAVLRLFSFWKFLVDGTIEGLGVKTSSLIPYGTVASTATVSLLSGKFYPAVAAKAIGFMNLIAGGSVVVAPKYAAKNMFLGINMEGEEMEQTVGWYRRFGYGLFVSAVHMLSLAFGSDPATALGLTAVAYAFTDVNFMATKGDDNIGVSRKKFVVDAVVMGLFALKFLLQRLKSGL